jgi:hypothetical protein
MLCCSQVVKKCVVRETEVTLLVFGKGHHRLTFESVDTFSSKIHFKIVIPFTRMAHRRCQRRIPTNFKTVSFFGYMPKVKQVLLIFTVRFLSAPCFHVPGLPLLFHNFVFRGAGKA